MHPHSSKVAFDDSFLLLDEEFDKGENTQPLIEPATSHLVLCYDRAWDDQLDEGEEMSL